MATAPYQIDYSGSGLNPAQAANGNPYQVNGQSFNVGTQVSSANTTSPTTSVSPVVTAKSAQSDYNNKWAAFQSITQAMNQQSEARARDAMQAQATQAQNDLQASETNLKQQGIDVQKAQADAQKMTAQTKLNESSPTAPAAPVQDTRPGMGGFSQAPQNTAPAASPAAQQPTSPQTSNPALSPSQATLDYVSKVQGVQDERTQALSSFMQTANSLVVGLQASESALINATTQQFQTVIQAQQNANASQLGAAKESAARSGQEYTPAQAGSTIANAISTGNQRLSEINSQMAKTIADLNVSFAKENYQMMNDNFAKLDKSFADREATFKEVHDAVAADVKEQQARQDKVKSDVSAIASSAAKNGATAAVLKAIQSSPDVQSAISSAGGFLQEGTGTLGDYLQYKRDAESKGLVPTDYQSYKDLQDAKASQRKINEATAINKAKQVSDEAFTTSDKNQQKLEQQYRGVLSKEFSSRTGSLGVENGKVNQANHLNSLISQYYDPKTGNYNVPTAQYAELVLGLASLVAPYGTTAASDRAELMAKTAAGDIKGAVQFITGVPQNGNTQDIIKNLVDSIDRQAETATANREAALQNLRDQAPTDLEQKRIDALNKSTKMVEYSGQDRISKKNVNDYIQANPDAAEAVAKLYEVPGATDKDIEDYLRLQGKL